MTVSKAQKRASKKYYRKNADEINRKSVARVKMLLALSRIKKQELETGLEAKNEN